MENSIELQVIQQQIKLLAGNPKSLDLIIDMVENAKLTDRLGLSDRAIKKREKKTAERLSKSKHFKN